MMSRALALLLLLAPASAFAQQETVEVDGLAAIVGEDVPMARDKALDDAKRKAVEQVAGTQISSRSVTESFQLVEERIYAQASGFVAKYDILSEAKEGDGTYRVRIKAVVDKGAIAKNLNQIFDTKPRVILLIAEQNVGAGSYSYWWGRKGFSAEMDIMQTALMQSWKDRGFKFIDPGMLSGKLTVSRAMKTPELRESDVLAIGEDADADVAIVGKVLVTNSGPVMDGVKMSSFHAVGNLRAINIDTAEVIASVDETATAAHINGNVGGRLAIKNLAKVLGAQLEKEIVGKWTKEAAGAQDISLVFRGVRGAKQIGKLRRFLESEVRGVESVRTRRRRNRVAFFDLRYRGDGLRLSKSLDERQIDGLTLEVTKASKNKLVLAVAR